MNESRCVNGLARQNWPAFDHELRRAEQEAAAHPGLGLLVAAMLGILLGIWVKRA